MEKIGKILLIGSGGQIGSTIKGKLKKISKNTKCLSRKDLDLKNICYVCQEKV